MKFIFLPPPPFLIYVFSLTDYKEAHTGEIFSAFFFAILYILSQLGKKYAFLPLFLSSFNHFFPQPVIWPYFCPPPPWGGGVNRKIYTPEIS